MIGVFPLKQAYSNFLTASPKEEGSVDSGFA
jgi:hypothetical protein